MYFYSGLGSLVFWLLLGGFLAVGLIGGSDTSPVVYSAVNALVGVVCFVVGRRVNSPAAVRARAPDFVPDHHTDENDRLVAKYHCFFFLHMEWWGAALFGIGVAGVVWNLV